MDEARAQVLLRQIAADPPPPPALDIGLARRRGRGRRRWRRAAAGAGSAVALGAAVAVVLATGALPSVPAGPSVSFPAGPISAQPPVAGPGQAPRQFSLLKVYASFGWLPTGFTLAAGRLYGSATDPLSVTLGAGQPATRWQLVLEVFAKGVCKIGAAVPSSARTAGATRWLACNDVASPMPVEGGGYPILRTAPAIVAGFPAYWMNPAASFMPGTQSVLAWEYAPDAWAVLMLGTPAAQRNPPPAAAAALAELVKIAQHVGYGQDTPVYFPFQLTSVPAGWQVWQVQFGESGGRLLANGLRVGPAGQTHAGGFQLWVYPGDYPGWSGVTCTFRAPGHMQDVTVGGFHGVLTIYSSPQKSSESLCVPHVHGMAVNLQEYSSGSVTKAFTDSLTKAFTDLRILGTDPVRWVTSPLG